MPFVVGLKIPLLLAGVVGSGVGAPVGAGPEERSDGTRDMGTGRLTMAMCTVRVGLPENVRRRLSLCGRPLRDISRTGVR